MRYVPSFIKIVSGIRKLLRADSETHRQHRDRINLLPFFLNNATDKNFARITN
jgi:hypothetical protein